MGQPNVLRIEKRGSTLTFHLNDTSITRNDIVSHGYIAGFINYTNMRLEVDYFDFTQDLPAIKPVENLPHGLTKENLGSGVNSVGSDLSPIISADGKTLYFGREEYEFNTGGKDDPEDIWTSSYD